MTRNEKVALGLFGVAVAGLVFGYALRSKKAESSFKDFGNEVKGDLLNFGNKVVDLGLAYVGSLLGSAVSQIMPAQTTTVEIADVHSEPLPPQS